MIQGVSIPIGNGVLSAFFHLEGDALTNAHAVLGPAWHVVAWVKEEGLDKTAEVLGNYTDPNEKIGYISIIDVAKQKQGQGIGSQLMDRLLEWADQNGVDRLFALAVPDNDKRLADLLRWYKRHGFERTGLELAGSPILARISRLQTTSGPPQDSMIDAAFDVLRALGPDRVTWVLQPGEWALPTEDATDSPATRVEKEEGTARPSRAIGVERYDPQRAKEESKLFFPIFWLAENIRDHRIETAMALAAVWVAGRAIEGFRDVSPIYFLQDDDPYPPRDARDEETAAVLLQHHAKRKGMKDGPLPRFAYAFRRSLEGYVEPMSQKQHGTTDFSTYQDFWISPFQDCGTAVVTAGVMDSEEFGWAWLEAVSRVLKRLPQYEDAPWAW